MSLLTTRAPHVVEVQKRRRAKNGRGVTELMNDGPRVKVRCAVQGAREWSTEEQRLDSGLQVLSIERIFSKTWPGDVNSLVYFRGEEYETVGSPVQASMSRNTSHYSITVQSIGVDPLVAIP